MIRKLTLLFLLCVGFHMVGKAQIRDSVKISLPRYDDTSCFGGQLTFTAKPSSDTFTGVTYRWYTNHFFTGVTIDTFKTTALNDGDSVYCTIYFTNSFGVLDSFRSNVIYVYHRTSIAPAVFISIIEGSNPDCAGSPLTFLATPKNGGTTPVYQWLINGVPILGSDSTTFTRVFSGTDTISCVMTSNSPCAAPFPVTDTSNIIPVIHTHLLAAISIINLHNPICSGGVDTFYATVSDPGTGSSVDWYVNSVQISGAVGNRYITDSLRNGDRVYAILNTPDDCALSDSLLSNIIIMTVIPLKNTTITSLLIHGANPGCLDSTLTYASTYTNFGTAPVVLWLVNGDTAAIGVDTFTSKYAKGDILTFRIYATDGGCYTHDTLSAPSVFMVRDSTPAAPLLSLIGNRLVNNMMGKYRWYFGHSNTYTGGLVAGITDQTYHAPSADGGTGYYYTILDTGNCPSPPSNIIYISLLKIRSMNGAHEAAKLFPNPTTGVLNIDFNGRNVNANVEVYNIVGQSLMHSEVTNADHHELNMANLPEGNYMIVLRDNDDGSTTTYKVHLQN